MNTTPAIRTTVVGSYPVPDWLVALPSQQALIDATRVVRWLRKSGVASCTKSGGGPNSWS